MYTYLYPAIPYTCGAGPTLLHSHVVDIGSQGSEFPREGLIVIHNAPSLFADSTSRRNQYQFGHKLSLRIFSIPGSVGKRRKERNSILLVS